MAEKITINGRFATLEDAERAATEIRSLFQTQVDIRALSENNSFQSSKPPRFPVTQALPGTNFSYAAPFSAASPANTPSPDGLGGVYGEEAYVLEAQVDPEAEEQVAEIFQRYGAERI